MYLIVGLGNPEPDYSNTRHNMGFNVINKITDEANINVTKTKFNSLYGMGQIGDEKVILVKPQTYMNLSGDSIIQFKKFYKIQNKNIIVIYDDMDLSIGNIRLRKNGGAGTHNGMKSVIDNLKTEEFPRIRIGIGTPENKEDLINYVIGQIPKREKEVLEKAIEKAKDSIFEILKNGIDIAMNKFN